MTGERIICPVCHLAIPGAKRVGASVHVLNQRGTVRFSSGDMTCRCGANLVFVAGTVTEFAAPDRKPREIIQEGVQDHGRG